MGEINKSRINIGLGLMIVGVILAVGILASVPPVDRDALTHHLYVPKLYLQHGGIYEIPDLEFSYYPMNLDLLYLIPLYFNNDIVPKFIHFAFALMTVLLIYRYLVCRIDKTYALLGSLFFLSIPVIIRLSSTVYVDLGLICFYFAALLYLFHWIENGFEIKYLLISAAFCGLALGTKYNALIGLFLLGLFVPFVYVRFYAAEKNHALKAMGFSAAFIVVSLLVFSPWMIRNAVWTGNPVYPLYDSAFNSEMELKKEVVEEAVPEAVLEKGSRMSHFNVRRQIYGESWWEIVLIPLRVFFQGMDDNPELFDGKLNPFLLLLPMAAFFGLKKNTPQERVEKTVLLFFSALFLLFAFVQRDIRIRYFAPILPPLVILAMFGLHNIQNLLLGQRYSVGIQKGVILLIVGAMLAFNGAYLVSRFSYDRPMDYITGKVTRDEYIQYYRPEYASFQYANQNLPGDSKILGLYVGNRGYYSDLPISFDLKIMPQFAQRAESAKDLLENLQQAHFTHIIVNIPLFNHWVQHYSIHEKQILKEFFDDYVITEFSKDGYGLLRIIT